MVRGSGFKLKFGKYSAINVISHSTKVKKKSQDFDQVRFHKGFSLNITSNTTVCYMTVTDNPHAKSQLII